MTSHFNFQAGQPYFLVKFYVTTPDKSERVYAGVDTFVTDLSRGFVNVADNQTIVERGDYHVKRMRHNLKSIIACIDVDIIPFTVPYSPENILEQFKKEEDRIERLKMC